MPRYYILFQKWEGDLRVKGTALFLSSDLTGLTLEQSLNRGEPMYFPTKEAAMEIFNPILKRGLPPSWKVSVEKEVETDFIVSIRDEEIDEIFNVLAEGIN